MMILRKQESDKENNLEAETVCARDGIRCPDWNQAYRGHFSLPALPALNLSAPERRPWVVLWRTLSMPLFILFSIETS